MASTAAWTTAMSRRSFRLGRLRSPTRGSGVCRARPPGRTAFQGQRFPTSKSLLGPTDSGAVISRAALRRTRHTVESDALGARTSGCFHGGILGQVSTEPQDVAGPSWLGRATALASPVGDPSPPWQTTCGTAADGRAERPGADGSPSLSPDGSLDGRWTGPNGSLRWHWTTRAGLGSVHDAS